jgi:hypothetical protein
VICKASESKEWVIAKQRSRLVNNMLEVESKLTKGCPSSQIPGNGESLNLSDTNKTTAVQANGQLRHLMQNEAFHHPKNTPQTCRGKTEAKAAELPRRNKDFSEQELGKAVIQAQLAVWISSRLTGSFLRYGQSKIFLSRTRRRFRWRCLWRRGSRSQPRL